MWEAIGLCAAFLTMFAFVPQIIKVFRTKSVKDVSLITLLQLSLGVCLWIAYGIHIKDVIVIGANIITVFCLTILLTMYFYYRRNKV